VLNRRFHSRIMAFTRNKHLASIYENLDRELHIWRKRALILDGNVRASSAEHALILEVLRNGNPSRIAEVLRDHSLAGRNRLLRTMPEQIARFEGVWDHED
jgi:DNA-binding GntR family transcriptional regulator